MAASLQPTSSETTILDLNDDCLEEVFAHMDMKTLSNVADVCIRFKQHTMHAAPPKIKKISFSSNILFWEEEPMMYVYPMIRNFGEFIEEIKVRGRDVEKRIIQYLSTYCVGKSIELRWDHLRVTDEIAILLRPLFGRVQKLDFRNCHWDEVLLRNLSLWSTGLQESEYGASKPANDHEKQFDHLRQKNLKSISFRFVPDVKNPHIEELLQQNRQLKEVELLYCDSLGTSVLESIARNGLAIEKLGFLMHWNCNSSNRDHIKYFLQFHELKSLNFGTICDDSYVQSVVHEIASVNTGLDYLYLCDFDLRHNANEFIGGMSKFQQLKTLQLEDVKNLTAAHIIEICKHAKELSHIYFEEVVTKITNDDLLEIVKNARKLQEFHWWFSRSYPNVVRTIIDGDTFFKLAKLVGERDEKTNLLAHLTDRLFSSTIPASLKTAVKNLKIRGLE